MGGLSRSLFWPDCIISTFGYNFRKGQASLNCYPSFSRSSSIGKFFKDFAIDDYYVPAVTDLDDAARG